MLIFSRTKIGADRLAHGWRRPASAASRFTPTGRWISAGRPWKDSGAAGTRCSWRPISLPAASTSTAFIRSINYELPDSADTYVHRVGRTGRADEAGHALTLVAPEERHARLPHLEKSVGVRLESDRHV